ncbi:MAG TPA: amidohydrolase family protein [Gemmatimonadaceae bacterium]|nr:amidohydrolase family protein [Gemmatimonadaceae bacterium]
MRVSRASRMIPAIGLALFVVPSCARSPNAPLVNATPDPPRQAVSQPIVIVDVTVIPMDAEVARAHQSVLVTDGKIAWVGDASRLPQTDAVVVPGAGRYLMPALIDMHAHLHAAEGYPYKYIANGVGTIRNMWGTASVARLVASVAAGATEGPSIVSASPGLDGNPPQWPGTIMVTAPESAKTAVDAQRAAGWPFLKVYTSLSPSVFDAIMAAARDAGIAPIGHVPLAVDIRHALVSGMRSIEHLTGYDRAVSRRHNCCIAGWADADTTLFADLVDATVTASVWNCPTLAIDVVLAQQLPASQRDIAIGNRRAFVRMLSKRGAPLLLGTDAGIGVVAPGSSLHDELREFVTAGLSPYAALRAGTIDAARFLGRDDLGRITVGAVADLLLLQGNPLLDVTAAQRIEGMVLHGAWIPKSVFVAP